MESAIKNGNQEEALARQGLGVQGTLMWRELSFFHQYGTHKQQLGLEITIVSLYPYCQMSLLVLQLLCSSLIAKQNGIQVCFSPSLVFSLFIKWPYRINMLNNDAPNTLLQFHWRCMKVCVCKGTETQTSALQTF